MENIIYGITDFFKKIQDLLKGYNVEINQKIRERERKEKNNYLCGNAARAFLAHLSKHCREMSNKQKWEEIEIMWEVWNMNTEEFNNMIAWMLEGEGYNVTIEDGFEDGGIDMIGFRGTKENPEYISVQCKNWKFKAIGENDIDTFYGKSRVQDAKNKGSKLLYVTSSHFTQNAGRELELHKIESIDYMGIMDMYKDYKESQKHH